MQSSTRQLPGIAGSVEGSDSRVKTSIRNRVGKSLSENTAVVYLRRQRSTRLLEWCRWRRSSTRASGTDTAQVWQSRSVEGVHRLSHPSQSRYPVWSFHTRVFIQMCLTLRFSHPMTDILASQPHTLSHRCPTVGWWTSVELMGLCVVLLLVWLHL